MTYTDAPRLPEPRDFDQDVWAIVGTYTVEGVVFLKARALDALIFHDEVDANTYTIEYELEILKNCQPEIKFIRVYTFDVKEKKLVQVKVDGSFEATASDFLEDDHSRWQQVTEWLWNNGERLRTEKRAA